MQNTEVVQDPVTVGIAGPSFHRVLQPDDLEKEIESEQVDLTDVKRETNESQVVVREDVHQIGNVQMIQAAADVRTTPQTVQESNTKDGQLHDTQFNSEEFIAEDQRRQST